MKKSSQISMAFLIIIIGSLCVNPAVAQIPDVTPYGFWGMSSGDQLCYNVTSDEFGSWVNYSMAIYIENNTDGTVGSEHYNFLTATFYNHTGNFWINFTEIILSGYNDTTYKWFNGDLVRFGFPIPAPLPFNWTLVNQTIYNSMLANGWTSNTSSTVIGGSEFIYTEGLKTMSIEYDTASGICLNNTLEGDSYGVILDCECPWIKPLNPLDLAISGYPLAVFLGIFTVGVITIIWTILRKKKKS